MIILLTENIKNLLITISCAENRQNIIIIEITIMYSLGVYGLYVILIDVIWKYLKENFTLFISKISKKTKKILNLQKKKKKIIISATCTIFSNIIFRIIFQVVFVQLCYILHYNQILVIQLNFKIIHTNLLVYKVGTLTENSFFFYMYIIKMKFWF